MFISKGLILYILAFCCRLLFFASVALALIIVFFPFGPTIIIYAQLISISSAFLITTKILDYCSEVYTKKESVFQQAKDAVNSLILNLESTEEEKQKLINQLENIGTSKALTEFIKNNQLLDEKYFPEPISNFQRKFNIKIDDLGKNIGGKIESTTSKPAVNGALSVS